jgi:hypothetical protein
VKESVKHRFDSGQYHAFSVVLFNLKILYAVTQYGGMLCLYLLGFNELSEHFRPGMPQASHCIT